MKAEEVARDFSPAHTEHITFNAETAEAAEKNPQ